MAKLEPSSISIPVTIDLRPARTAVKRAQRDLETANRELAAIERTLEAARFGIKTEVTE